MKAKLMAGTFAAAIALVALGARATAQVSPMPSPSPLATASPMATLTPMPMSTPTAPATMSP